MGRIKFGVYKTPKGNGTEQQSCARLISKVGKDFGCGFYLSADKAQAIELAERKTEQLGIGTPTLNTYIFD